MNIDPPNIRLALVSSVWFRLVKKYSQPPRSKYMLEIAGKNILTLVYKHVIHGIRKIWSNPYRRNEQKLMGHGPLKIEIVGGK